MRRTNQKQIWTAPAFAARLEIIKAKRLIQGEKVSIAGLTEKIVSHPLFKEIEKELAEQNIKIKLGLRIKADKRLG